MGDITVKPTVTNPLLTDPDKRLDKHSKISERSIIRSNIESLVLCDWPYFNGANYIYYIDQKDNSLHYGPSRVDDPTPEEMLIERTLRKILSDLPRYKAMSKEWDEKRKKEASSQTWFDKMTDDVSDYYTIASKVGLGTASQRAWDKISSKLFEGNGRIWKLEEATTKKWPYFTQRTVPIYEKRTGMLGFFSGEVKLDKDDAVQEYRFDPKKVTFNIMGSGQPNPITSRSIEKLHPDYVLESVANFSTSSGVGVKGKIYFVPRTEDQGVMVIDKNKGLHIEYSADFFKQFHLEQWGPDSDIEAFAQFFLLVKDGKLPKKAPLNLDPGPKAIIATYPNGDVSYIRVRSGTLLEVSLYLQRMGVKDAVLCDAGAVDNFTIRNGNKVIQKRRSIDGTTSRFLVLPKK